VDQLIHSNPLQARTATEAAAELRMPGVASDDAPAQLRALHEAVRSSVGRAVRCAELSERSAGGGGVAEEFVLLGWDIVVQSDGKAWICEGQRGFGCISRQDTRCFSQRYLRAEYAMPRQALAGGDTVNKC
jgi:hypothetical protein